MTPEQKAAFVIAQSVAMFAEIEGMKVMNRDRERGGYAFAYGEESFLNVAVSYGLHYNQLIKFFQD